MSETVDTRIVEMRFDNKKFESNVKQSMSTLDKLKQKLKLKGASKGLLEVEKTSRKVNFEETGGSLEKLGKKFSILEQMAIGAFRRIGERAADAGIKMAKSLSIDQVTAGWNKYAEKTTAVQTIMANIKDDASKFVDEASKMDYVNEQLEKLMWFSDETSYRFVDMTGNVGKFIANGQNLEESVTAMQGIATWAAVSGQNAQTASRAMYNISQAMGVGSMKVKDWMSIENANMATSQFKELAITIGQKQGKIKEGQVTVENFRESLSGAGTNGWFDKDVMMEVFNVYGEAANKIRSFLETEKGAGMTATEVIRNIKEGNQDLIDEIGVTADSIGFKALSAAQEAKTFGEVVDATADAASTKWLQFFENIFGNYLEAKKMWTNLSEDLYDIFVEPLNGMNEVMSMWKRGRLIKEFESPEILEAYESGELDKLDNKLGSITKSAAEAAVKAAEADDSMFREIETLANGTQQLVTYTKDASGQYVMSIKKIIDADKHFLSGRTTLIEGFKNLLNVFLLDWEDDEGKEHLSVLGSLKRAFMEVFFPDLASAEDGGKKSIAEKLLELTEKFRDFTQKLKPLGDKLKNIFKGFFTIFKIIGKLIGAITKPFKKLFREIFRIDLDSDTGILSFLDNLSNKIQEFDKFLDSEGIFDSISEWIEKGIGKVKGAIDWVSQSLTGLSLDEVISKISNFFTNFNFKEKFEKIGNFFRGMVSEIGKVEADNIPDKLTPLQNFWLGLKGFAKGLMGVLSFIVNKVIPFLANVFGQIGQFFGKIFGKLSGKSVTKEADNAVSNVEKVGEKVEETVEKVNPVLSFFGKIFQGIKGFFEKASPFFDALGEWIKTALGKFGEFLAGLAKDGKLGQNVTNFAKGGFFVALIVLIKTIKDVIKEFKGLGGAVKGMFNGVSGMFNNISGLFGDARERFKKKSKLNSFKSIAKSILMIAGALFLVAKAFEVFANIEFKNTSVGIIAAIFAGFIAVSALAGFAAKKILKTKEDIKALKSMVVFMAVLTVVLMLLSKAFEMFSRIEFGNVPVGIVSAIFAGFIAVATLVAWAATKFLGSKKSEKALLQMAAFMAAVAHALTTLSIALLIAGWVKADSDSLTVIGLIFAGFVGIVTLVAWAATKFAKNKTAERALSFMAGFMMSVAQALVVFSLALRIAGNVESDPISLTIIGFIFAGFIGITTLVAWAATKFAKNKTAERALPLMAAFMMSVATALLILAASFAVFSLVDFEKTPIGTISLIFAVFIILTAGIALIGGLLMKNGASIAGIAMMAGLMVTAAVSLGIVALAFSVLSSNISPEQMKAALAIMITFAAIVALLAVIGTVLAGTGVGVVGMALVAAIILAIGTACLMAGAGIALMVSSISNLIDAFVRLMKAISIYGPGFVFNLRVVAEGMLNTIIDLAPKMETAAIVVIKTIASALIKSLPIVSKALVLLLIYLMQNVRETLTTTVPILVMTIIDLIDTLANTLRESAPLLTKAVRNLIEAIIETVIVSIAGIVEPFGAVGEWIAEKITKWIPGLREAFKVAEDTDTVLDHIGETSDVDVDVSVGDPNAAAESGEKDVEAYLEAFRSGTESVDKGDLVSGLLSEYGVGSGSGLDAESLLGGSGDLDMSSLLGDSSVDTSMFSDVMTGKIGDMTDAIKEETPETRKASEGMAKAIEDPITALDSKKWGIDIALELAKGMKSSVGSVEEASNTIAQTVDDVLGFSEPERGPLSNFHTYAPDMIKLWCQGVKKNIGMVADSSDSIAEKTDEGFSSALDYISKLIDGGMTDELTIRPVMDLSDIESGVDRIKSMLSGNPYSLQSAGGIVSSAAYDVNRSIGATGSPSSQIVTSNVTNHNTFNITNPDPDAVAKRVSVILGNNVKRNAAVYSRP